MSSHEPEELKYLLLHSNEPLVFKNKLNWDLLNWNLDDWGSLLKNEELSFRCGKNSFTREPQWERTTKTVKASFDKFLSSATESHEWMYFDYKYLKEWFVNLEMLKNNVDWSVFGFPEVTSDDCTIWIGSKGAHTPCHSDTYGCNLIAQIYGQKLWLLFPPEEDLKPSRVPYEESSVYSKLNFFSPIVDDFKSLSVGTCRRVVLDPGDVLFVPHKWWHYVENLDIAISLNVWLPLPQDDEERLKESLVQLFMSQVMSNANSEMKSVVLNPNSDEVVEKMPLNASLNLVNKCKQICKSAGKIHRSDPDTEKRLDEKYRILKLSSREFELFLEGQSQRFSQKEEIASGNEETNKFVDLINAFTHPEVISLIKSKLVE